MDNGDCIKLGVGPVTGNLIQGNYLSGAGRDGIDVAFITDLCEYCKNDQICTMGEVTITDTASDDCGGVGADLECSNGPMPGPMTNNEFIGNVIWGNGYHGIALKVTSNKCKGNDAFMIGNNTIKNNLLIGNGLYGLELKRARSVADTGEPDSYKSVPLSSYGLVESNVFCANGNYQLVLQDSQLTHLKGNWLKSNCAGSNCWGQQLCNAPKAVSCMDYTEATPFKPSIGLFGNRFTQMSNNYWPPGDCAIDSSSYQCINDQAVVSQGGPSSGEPTASNREVVINKALDAVPYHSEDDDNDGVSNLLEAIYFGTDPTSSADVPDNYDSTTFVAADWDICSANPASAKVFRVSFIGSDENPCSPLAPCATLY
ncbi:MAG TPA: hypothetical protein EYN66_07560, partial [Myxococcales bacterium]|nr:hypothetical protein [Myxococcales bacterium]